MADRVPLDIRCTDTANTPNSVLLVGSEGDLYTEGYAHDGKVLLFRAGEARPDQLRSLWPHVNRFGHARRYLNWNPYFYRGISLENICYDVPIPAAAKAEPAALVETESKHRVADPQLLRELLTRSGSQPSPPHYSGTSTTTQGNVPWRNWTSSSGFALSWSVFSWE